MKKLNEDLKSKVLDWAKERNLLNPNNKFAQYAKLGEELSELFEAEYEEDILDAIGDSCVVLIILCEQLGIEFEVPNVRDFYNDTFKDCSVTYLQLATYLQKYALESMYFIRKITDYLVGELNVYAPSLSLEHCIELAYNEIKDRKGKTINGTFIKNI